MGGGRLVEVALDVRVVGKVDALLLLGRRGGVGGVTVAVAGGCVAVRLLDDRIEVDLARRGRLRQGRRRVAAAAAAAECR